MSRHLVLVLGVCAAACVHAEDPSVEPIHRTEQAAEPLDTPSQENAIRFLEQATFGPRLAHGASPLPLDSVEHVVQVGITQAITEQLGAAPSTFDGTSAGQDLGAQFFVHAIEGPDQLRQRAAFALSQILVVSQLGIPNPSATPESEPEIATAGYLNLLSQYAFGNFRDLLEAISRDPAMGQFLDQANNRAFNTSGDFIEPNENYARELLQLFTVGLHKLKENGTLKLDCTGDGVADASCTAAAGGVPIPTYTEAEVRAFASTLSGWTYAKAGGTGTSADCPGQGKQNSASYGAPLIACDANHDSSQQTLLRGVKTTAGATAAQHLTQALNNIFNDPNVPPFISKQLIQHLVTSNPSPAYVQRVVGVFKDNGSGVRGDLGAVVRAILEDDEARGPLPPTALTATYGHLRSPALFITHVVRWLDGHLDLSNGNNPGGKLNTASRNAGQWVPRPPSVFSYYYPNEPLPGDDGLVGPEFGIVDTSTATARANFLHDLLFTTAITNSGVVIDLNVLPDDPGELVVWLGDHLLHNAISSDLQLAISGALADPRAGTTLRKKKLALYLTALSPEFQIQR